MDRVSGTAGTAAAAQRAVKPGVVKPGVAFKHVMARAMEGWGPDAPAAQLRARPSAAPAQVARGAPAAPVGAARPAAPQPGPELPAAFRQLIARLESGGPGRPDGGYGARNPTSGALGRYQMLAVALRDIGWQDAAGGWTPLAASHGVRSEAEFLATPAAQEVAMSAFLRRAETQLDRNGSLARAGGSVGGLDGAAVPLTDAGLVAAAHRSGAQSVARYLAFVGNRPETPLGTADRNTFAAVERRLRQFAELPYQVAAQVAARRMPPAA